MAWNCKASRSSAALLIRVSRVILISPFSDPILLPWRASSPRDYPIDHKGRVCSRGAPRILVPSPTFGIRTNLSDFFSPQTHYLLHVMIFEGLNSLCPCMWRHGLLKQDSIKHVTCGTSTWDLYVFRQSYEPSISTEHKPVHDRDDRIHHFKCPCMDVLLFPGRRTWCRNQSLSGWETSRWRGRRPIDCLQ